MYMVYISQKGRERELRSLIFFSTLNPETKYSERDSDTDEVDLCELYLPGIYWGWGGGCSSKEPEFVNVQNVIFSYVFWTGMRKKKINSLRALEMSVLWVLLPQMLDISWVHLHKFVYVWTSASNVRGKKIIWYCDQRNYLFFYLSTTLCILNSGNKWGFISQILWACV